ncbi:hypothetical protein HPB47_027119 [Ixodes persulcatus]|uniref:Uncharacterized protein n=1 Tax=Ixodes persulcatus TaxID=34615 RepID=A0AC60PYG0_IXOPE|nr:hypothetical protein HPB47_027119 [Ixodes persulcatus]
MRVYLRWDPPEAASKSRFFLILRRDAVPSSKVARDLSDNRRIGRDATRNAASRRDERLRSKAVPEVREQGDHIERAVTAANQDIWRLGREMGFKVIDINWDVRNNKEQAFEGSGIHFSPYVGRAVGWRMARKAVAFLGGPKALKERNPARSKAKGL